jgi:hypothetical protein
MIRWLSPINPTEAHERAISAYLEGSVAWFFETEEFAKWDCSPGSLLWLSGFRKQANESILI